MNETTKIREDASLDRAKKILVKRLARDGIDLADDAELQTFLRLHLGAHQVEHGMVVAMDDNRRLLGFETWPGELRSISMLPRRIATFALGLGATKVILAHSHPENICCPLPSGQDIHATHRMREILQWIDIHLVDAFVVSGKSVVSVAMCDIPSVLAPEGLFAIGFYERFAEIARYLGAARKMLDSDGNSAPHNLLIDHALREALSGSL